MPIPIILVTWEAETQKDGSLRPDQANSSKDSHLQKENQSKMVWRCGSSPKFKAQSHQKQNKTKQKNFRNMWPQFTPLTQTQKVGAGDKEG
jgi:hypothetical protein